MTIMFLVAGLTTKLLGRFPRVVACFASKTGNIQPSSALGNLEYRFCFVLEPQNLIVFNGAAVFWLLEFSKRGNPPLH